MVATDPKASTWCFRHREIAPLADVEMQGKAPDIQNGTSLVMQNERRIPKRKAEGTIERARVRARDESGSPDLERKILYVYVHV